VELCRPTSYFPVSGGSLTYSTSDQCVSLSLINAGVFYRLRSFSVFCACTIHTNLHQHVPHGDPKGHTYPLSSHRWMLCVKVNSANWLFQPHLTLSRQITVIGELPSQIHKPHVSPPTNSSTLTTIHR